MWIALKAFLHYLQQCMPQEEHVSYIHAKWESLEHDEIEPHDIVLGVNCFTECMK